MKNLFSVYNYNSIKKLFFVKFGVIGILTAAFFIIVSIKTSHLSEQNFELKKTLKEVVNENSTININDYEQKDNTSFWLNILIAANVAMLIFIFIKYFKDLSKYFHDSINIIKKQTDSLRNGIISERITGIKHKDEFGKIYWDLNDTTDQIEAMVKELSTSIEYITNKQYFRPVLIKGIRGEYKAKLKYADENLKNYSKTLISEKELLENKASELLNAMEKFSSGDLTAQLKPDNSNGLMHRLFEGFNSSVQNINFMILELNEAVNSTITSGEQIGTAIEQMINASEEQSFQTKNITESVNEMIKTVSETAKNTSSAANSAKDAESLALEGSKVVKHTVGSMAEIGEIVSQASKNVLELDKNSNKINEIIKVIRDISEQTNLLAINAAIEASRAGEHGRGFAVVADEVKKLSDRTTNSTLEISKMIKQIHNETESVVNSINHGKNKVESGITLAESAGEAIDDILCTTNDLVDEISQVAAAGEQQSATSDAIADNIRNVNNVISDSLNGIRDTANAADELNIITNNLQALVKKFKIKEEESYNYSLKEY